jgi:N-acyl-D-amino-acid deacylase
MRTLFTNALLIDGTGAPGFPGWLLIEQDRIVAMERAELTPPQTHGVVDLEGAALCPGFIDTHSHSDLALLVEPHVPPKLRQGVTTEILGQDGLALAPLPARYIVPWRKNLSGLNGDSTDVAWDWGDLAGYLARLRKGGVGTNTACLAAHGNIRMEVVGLDDRIATDEEIARMQAVLEREIESGAIGLSTGLVYTPCAYADTRELTALCATAARHGLPLVIHQRSESGSIVESMQEVLDLARATGVHIHFSHFKVCGLKYADRLDPSLALLDQATAEGLSVSLDQYPYMAGSTMLSVILPPWAHAGGTEHLLSRLADPAQRKRMIHDIEFGLPGWDDFVDFAGVENIYVTHVADERGGESGSWAVGKSLAEIGELCALPPLEAACDLLLAHANAVSIVDFFGEEAHVEAILSRPETNVCTDGLLFGSPHPRVYGSFPRVLGRMVRERGVLELEEAVHKMTGKPADVFGLTGRGRLAPGAAADLVAFDPATIRDVGDFHDPRRFPEGVRMVCVNGRIEVRDDMQYGQLAGCILRRGESVCVPHDGLSLPGLGLPGAIPHELLEDPE